MCWKWPVWCSKFMFLASSYCIWKNELYFLNYNEHLIFFLYYKNYAFHSVVAFVVYLLLFVRSQGSPPCLPTRQLSKAGMSTLAAGAFFACETLKRAVSWVCFFSFFSFLLATLNAWVQSGLSSGYFILVLTSAIFCAIAMCYGGCGEKIQPPWGADEVLELQVSELL